MKPINCKSRVIMTFIVGSIVLFFNQSLAQVGIGTTTPLSTFEVNGSMGQTITTVSSDLTLDTSHNVIVSNNGSVAKTITLPSAIGIKGRVYTIKRSETSTANSTIATSLSQKIDGELSFLLTQSKQYITLISDGADWKIIGTSVPQTPVGELSYFSTTGTVISTNASTTDGSSNLFFCNPVTTVSANSVDFSSSENGKLKYIGATKKSFRITATVSASTNASGSYIFQLKKTNGNFLPTSRVIEKLLVSEEKTASLQALVTLDPNDSIELWVGKIGETGSVTIKSLNLFASGL